MSVRFLSEGRYCASTLNSDATKLSAACLKELRKQGAQIRSSVSQSVSACSRGRERGPVNQSRAQRTERRRCHSHRAAQQAAAI
jgi:hypothetical protein